jgi:opacity protein-like surface antigen
MIRVILLVLALVLPVSAAAQSQQNDEEGWSVSAGAGFTSSPNSHTVTFEASYQVNNHWSAGPLIQLGYDDDRKVIAPSLNVRYSFDLDSPLDIFLQGGAGGAFLESDNRPGDDNEFGFLVNFGGGIEYRVSDTLSITSHVLFNGLPGEVIDEDSFFSWQVAGMKVRF